MNDPKADDDIFDELAAETSHEESDPVSELDKELFTEVDVAKRDNDTVWEELAATSEVRIASDPDGGEEAIVPKHAFCERCEHFTAPPDATCTHDGTTIVEQTDMRHFRVRNCPIVEQRRELEERR